MKKSTIEKIKRDTRGAISILLACLMLPFFSLSAMLIEMGRYQSMVNALDSALGSSAYSTLSNYDSYIFDRFGLLSAAQSSDDVDADLTTTLQKYIGLQKTVDMRGVEIEELTAQGLNSLAEIEILKQQIQNYAAVIGPTKAFMEGFDINGIIAQLEKSLGMTGILKQLTSGFNLISKEVSMLEAYDDAKKQMKEVKKAKDTYDSAFSTWTGAVQSLINHLGTECPDSEEDEKGYNKWHSTKSELQTAANTAKSEYASAIGSLISQFETLQSNLNTAVNAQVSFAAQVDDFAITSINSYIDASMPENPDDDYKTAAGNLKTWESALNTGAKSASSKFSDLSKGFSIDRIKNAVTELNNQKSAVNSYSTSGVSSASSAPSASTYHYVNLEGLTDSKAIDQLMDDTQKEIEGSGSIDILLALGDVLGAIFKTEFIADGRLNVRLNTTHYNSTIGGLPSKVSKTPTYSFLAEDYRRSKGYLAAIDPDYDPTDPYGLIANSVQGKFQAVLDSIDAVQTSLDNLKDADWLIDKLKAAVAFGAALLDTISKIADFIQFLVKEIVSMGYERFLTFMYLAYNLPNRTNFASGATLSGYSFAKISRPMTVTGTNIPIAGDLIGLFNQPEEYSFIGAELEYIIWGNRSELMNQSSQFWAIYLLRLIIDIVQVVANSEVQQIMNSLNAVPYVGPILGIGFVILAVLAEPMCDTIFLVNGASAGLIKKTVYLTPSGLPKLISGFISLGMTKASQQKITQKACKAYGISLSETEGKASGAQSPVDPSKKPNDSVDLSKQPEKTPQKIFDKDKYLSGLLEFNYTEHSLFLMMLFGSEKTYLKRLADLIQCEMTMRNRLDKATITNQVTEEYKDFDIYQAYSTIRVNAKGTLKQLLPLPQVSDVNVFDRTLNRILYRGY